MDNRHFVDGHPSNSDNQWVSERLFANARHVTNKEYNLILDTVVVNCVDVALVSIGLKIFMARRINEPYKGGLALPGGRQVPGESYGQTAARHTKKNTGLDIEPSRFTFVRSDSWVWSRRAQEPQDRGCHMNGVTVFASLTEHEVQQIQCDDDISEPQWLSLQEASSNEEIHPAHRNAALDILRGKVE